MKKIPSDASGEFDEGADPEEKRKLWREVNVARDRFDAALGLYRAWTQALKEAGL